MSKVPKPAPAERCLIGHSSPALRGDTQCRSPFSGHISPDGVIAWGPHRFILFIISTSFVVDPVFLTMLVHTQRSPYV